MPAARARIRQPASATKQIKAIKDIWAGAHDSKGPIYPGIAKGGETGAGAWERYVTGEGPQRGRHFQLADGFLKFVVFDDPSYDFRTFNYDRDLPIALKKVAPLIDAVDPNLQPLQSHGAKLIVYHGWNDPSIPAQNSINYYESVVSALGGANHDAALERTQAFYRMFLVPGMQHCSGGPGTDRFDMLTALENWVEKGQAPECDRRLAHDGRQGRSDASALHVSADRAVQRQRQHRRCGELRLQVIADRRTRQRPRG